MASSESTEIVLLKASKGDDDPYAVVSLPDTSLYLDLLEIHIKLCFSSNDIILKAFREAGFNPHFIPVLHFDFLNSDQLAAVLVDSKDYSGELYQIL